MSYKKPNTGNTMNDYITALTDFTVLSPNLLKTKTGEEFEIWLDKLSLIDRRSLLLFLREHKNDIPKKYLVLAQNRYSEEI